MKYNTFCLILFLTTGLYAGNINKEFADKYLKNMQTQEQEINNSKMLDKLEQNTNGMDLNKIHPDKNSTKRLLKGIVFAKGDKEDANEVNSQIRSAEYQKNIQGMKEYILHDKELNFSSYMGKYEALAQKVIKGKINPNRFLSSDEKIYVVISSSVPKETLRNYIRSVQPVATDVSFVLRGVIGGIKHIKPTLDFISSLLIKDPNGDKYDRKNRFQAIIEINPKVTMRYGITEVPAVIFIKHFDNIPEMHTRLKKDNKEEVYIAYGDCNLAYALEKINKKARSKGLSKLLKAMNGGWFNK